jgi:hypothetical protein
MPFGPEPRFCENEPECGHEGALFSRWTVDVLGQLPLLGDAPS